MKKNFKRYNEAAREVAIKIDIAIKRGISSLKKPLQNNDGWGRDEIIAVAIALVIAAFVAVPSLRNFAKSLMDGMDTWYKNSIQPKIFETN